MRYWARIASDTERYGHWVPTGCTDFNQAKDYIEIYHREGRVIEWLRM